MREAPRSSKAAAASLARASRGLLPLAPAFLLAACAGQQSALQPSGPGAGDAAILWWAMLAGSVVIFALVLVLLLYAVLRPPERRPRFSTERMIVAGGIALPVVVLSILLPFGVNMGASTYAELPPDALTVRIDGRQWWWKVEYVENGSRSFTTANEIYLPVGEPVQILLSSSDVIHSFWVPRLAGKQDLIPGRTNRLVVEAEAPGTFRGQCAEFCGLAHTQMALYVVALPPDQFMAWVERQRAPAALPSTEAETRGAAAFAGNGCALCHAIRGHDAWGEAGPDLTNLGSRLTIGAGLVANTIDNVANWIAHNQEMKPGNRMPPYTHLDADTRHAIAAYLESLK